MSSFNTGGGGDIIPAVPGTAARAGQFVERDAASVDPLTIALVEETARVVKESVVTGRVRVRTQTETIEQLVHATLESEAVEVTRVPVDQPVTGPVPQVRIEGDLTVIPVFEEIIVVEKRLVLKEELHIRRRRSSETVELPVSLRRQHAEIERD